MVRWLRCVVLNSFLAISAFASGYFNEAELMATHRELFTPGKVGVVTNSGVAYYVYSGGVRKSKLMDAPRMMTIATLRAENALARYVRGERHTDVKISSALKVAKVDNGSEIVYVFAAPANGVAEVEKKIADVADLCASNHVAEVLTKPVSPDEKLRKVVAEVGERCPSNVECRVILAEEYLRKNSFEESAQEFERVLDRLCSEKQTCLSGRELDSLVRTGDALLSLGEYRKAKIAYSRILREGESEFRGRALQGLAKIQLELGVE